MKKNLTVDVTVRKLNSRSFGIFIHGHLLQNDLLFTKVVTYEKDLLKILYKYIKRAGKSSSSRIRLSTVDDSPQNYWLLYSFYF